MTLWFEMAADLIFDVERRPYDFVLYVLGGPLRLFLFVQDASFFSLPFKRGCLSAQKACWALRESVACCILDPIFGAAFSFQRTHRLL